MKRIRNIRCPIEKIGVDSCVLPPWLELLGVDGWGDVSLARPKLFIVRGGRRHGAFGGRFGRSFLAFDCDRDDVVAHRESVAAAEPMGLGHPMVGPVQKGAVGGDIVQPVAPVLIAYLAMLAGNVPGRVRQGPIEMRIASDVDAALAADVTANRSTIRQGGFVDQLKSQ